MQFDTMRYTDAKANIAAEPCLSVNAPIPTRISSAITTACSAGLSAKDQGRKRYVALEADETAGLSALHASNARRRDCPISQKGLSRGSLGTSG